MRGSFFSAWIFTLDRSVIHPLIDIISRPAPPSDPNLDRARRRAAMILTRFPGRDELQPRYPNSEQLACKGIADDPCEEQAIYAKRPHPNP